MCSHLVHNVSWALLSQMWRTRERRRGPVQKGENHKVKSDGFIQHLSHCILELVLSNSFYQSPGCHGDKQRIQNVSIYQTETNKPLNPQLDTLIIQQLSSQALSIIQNICLSFVFIKIHTCAIERLLTIVLTNCCYLVQVNWKLLSECSTWKNLYKSLTSLIVHSDTVTWTIS